nr:ORFIII-like polyprotein [Tanacetum cinerariifolium]
MGFQYSVENVMDHLTTNGLTTIPSERRSIDELEGMSWNLKPPEQISIRITSMKDLIDQKNLVIQEKLAQNQQYFLDEYLPQWDDHLTTQKQESKIEWKNPFAEKHGEDHTILYLSKEEENNNGLPYPKFQNFKKVAAQIIKQHEEHVFPSASQEESTQRYQPPHDSIMGPSVYPPVQQNPQPFYRPDYQFGYPQGKGKSLSEGYGEYYNSQWTLPPAWVESGVMLVLPADPGLWSERTVFPEAYSALKAITNEPQNITSQVRQLILLEDPYRGSTNEQDRAYKDLDRITCEETKKLWSFLEDFMQLATKSGRLYFPSTTEKLFAKLPPSLSKKIKESFRAKYPGLNSGVLPVIKFTHTFVSQMCKDTALAKELRDLSLCSAIPIPGYYKNNRKKYGMRKSRTYKGKPHNSHVKPFKRKYKDDRGRVKKCKYTPVEEIAFMAIEEDDESDSDQEEENYQPSHHTFMFHPGPPTKMAEMVLAVGSWKPNKELQVKSKECEHDWKENTVTNYTICYYCGILTIDMSRLNCPNGQLTTCALCARNYLGITVNVKGKQPQKLDEEKNFNNGEVKLIKELLKEKTEQSKESLLIRDLTYALKTLDQLRIEKERLEEQKNEEIKKLKTQLQKKEEVEVEFDISDCSAFGTTAIIDTGALACCINKKVVPKEALEPLTDNVFFNGLNSRQQATHKIKQGYFLIEGYKFRIPLIYAFDMNDSNGIKMLIGANFLRSMKGGIQIKGDEITIYKKVTKIKTSNQTKIVEIAELEVNEEEFMEINESIYFNQEGSKAFLEQFKPVIERLKHQGTMAMIVNSGTTIDPVTGKKVKGKERMVFNYKSLNDNTYNNQYSLPGFHQVAMDEESIPWTAFLVPIGLYEWLVMPFGLINAPTEHSKHLERMLKIYKDNGLVLSPTKMKIAVLTVDFLGAVIGEGTIKRQPHIIKKIVNFNEEELKTKKGLRSFLGILNYARTHIPKLGILLRPLYEKTNSHEDKRMKPSDYDLVKKIKEQVQNLPDLEIPPENAYIILETDGCMEGWGGIVKWKKKCTREMKELATVLYSLEEVLQSPNAFQKNIKITYEEVVKISNHFQESSQKLYSHIKNQEHYTDDTSLKPTKPQSDWINLMHGDFVYKMVTFMVDLYHDGLFASNPLRYLAGEHRVIKDINFEGLRPIYNDELLNDFVQALFENDCRLDMYTEHQGYDVLEMINDDRHCEDKSDSDFEDVKKGDNLDDVKDIVDFQTEGEENVDIPKLSIDDPWLNKLVGKGRFVGEMKDPIPGLKGRFFVEQNDPDENFVEPKYKVQSDFQYPCFDLDTPWNECKLVLGIKFESPSQLKQCLANYGVTHGYQLWYMQNDTYKLLVKCGRDVSAGKCAGKGSAEGSSYKGKGKLGKDRSEPSKNSIRSKFMINVSLGKCKRAKQAALFDHEEGLIDHYSKIWKYRQAVLDSNPGSTCHIDLEEKDDGLTYFKRIYLCFFGLKAGWLEGCKKVIEHRQCTRHIYANFKKKWSVLQFKRLFWKAAASSMNEQFLEEMSGVCKWVSRSRSLPCVHAVARPVPGSKLWKKSDLPKPLPPGHNKSKCTNAPKPKLDHFYEIPTDEKRKHGSNNVRERDQYQQDGPSVDEIPKYKEDPVIPESSSGNKRKEPPVKKKSSQVNEASDPSTEKAGSSAYPKKKANKRKKKEDSERIANLQAKKFKFDANGTGTTPEKAFDITDPRSVPFVLDSELNTTLEAEICTTHLVAQDQSSRRSCNVAYQFLYKMVTFVVDLYHDGLFVCNPVRYLSREHQVIKDINFEDMTYDNFFLVMRTLVLDKPLTKRGEDHTILHLSKEEENNNDLPYLKFQNFKKVAAQIIKQHEEHVFPSTSQEESTKSYQPPHDLIMGPSVYPPMKQNPQPFYRPDYQFGYPQGKDKSFSGGYGEYYNSQWTLPPTWTESGVMLVLSADPGLWSKVISRWESITINRLKNQTWSDNKAKLAFVENLLGEREGTIKLQPHIIKKIVNFNKEELKTKKGLRSFLGILNYARTHIPKLGILLRPLYEKTNAHGGKRMKPSDYDLVRKIKEQVQNLPDLEILPENAYIILETDGCMKGWGGIVKWKKSKGDPKSSERICAYASGKFSTTQSTIDAEINACINTLEKLKIYYLDKHQVTLRTDCKAIISFYNKTNSNKSSRVRWIKFTDAIIGTCVKINIEHIEETHNTLADSLSRLVNLCFAECTGEMKELAAAALYSVEEVLQSLNAFQKNIKITCEEVMEISNH